ncbi:acylphosphatase [Sediminihabitans luteus]|uniref:acylphosphatase n=1 Tax=Sediminihabitans luteus TaxID=1138585 RepID=A0A2M9D1R1_9CELL|nr:acylphosphatase [Sediminihabitans luteus]PJJ77938.1 acylphosphatase [Sediminihabitans luteus]GII99704.1 hypothetical protein Slu03_20820 [Sediminihabitans luteus]
MTDERSVRAVVHGEVQGVGFRWAARERLAGLGIDGEAVNHGDGTVHVEARGPRPAVDAFVTWLHGGGTPGRVERVDVRDE